MIAVSHNPGKNCVGGGQDRPCLTSDVAGGEFRKNMESKDRCGLAANLE